MHVILHYSGCHKDTKQLFVFFKDMVLLYFAGFHEAARKAK